MATDELAQTAIEQLNGKELDGRAINVSVARPLRSIQTGTVEEEITSTGNLYIYFDVDINRAGLNTQLYYFIP